MNNLDDLMLDLMQKKEEELKTVSVEDKLKLISLLDTYAARRGIKNTNDYTEFLPLEFNLLSENLKMRILEECLQKGISIEESEIYNANLEGDYSNVDTDTRNMSI